MEIEDKNLNLMNDFCSHINEDFKRVIGFNSDLKCSGSIKNNRYYFRCRECNKISGCSIEFYFEVYYSQLSYAVLTREERDTLTKDEYIALANKRRDIEYICIHSFYINPTRKGLGTKLMNLFFNRVHELEKIQRIYLTPADKDSEKFWNRFGFVDRKTVLPVANITLCNLVKIIR